MNEFESQLDVASNEIVVNAGPIERGKFIKKTYFHVGMAITLFAVLEYYLLQSEIAQQFAQHMVGSKWTWLIVLGVFMGVSFLADLWANTMISRPVQYAGLALYIVAEAILFMPLLLIAENQAPGVILSAGIMTIALLIGITFTAFTLNINFSFLGPVLQLIGFIALGVIIASIIVGFSLGVVFSGIMIFFAALSILYTTSNMIFEYHTEQYVAASMALFAGIALMFWYLVQFLMNKFQDFE